MREKAAQDWEIPGTLRRKIQTETIRGWLSDYRRGGFDALLPKVRRDAGSARAIPQSVADRLCEAKEQHPDYSVTLVIDLRLLTNYAMDSDNRLCLVLVGHPELRRRLNMAVHEALSQRVVVRAHVTGLSRDEVGPYLEHLLRLAGTELPLFEPSAQEALFQASSGLPRKLNLLAHRALLAAALAKAKSVNTEHLQSAMTEIS